MKVLLVVLNLMVFSCFAEEPEQGHVVVTDRPETPASGVPVTSQNTQAGIISDWANGGDKTVQRNSARVDQYLGDMKT